MERHTAGCVLFVTCYLLLEWSKAGGGGSLVTSAAPALVRGSGVFSNKLSLRQKVNGG